MITEGLIFGHFKPRVSDCSEHEVNVHWTLRINLNERWPKLQKCFNEYLNRICISMLNKITRQVCVRRQGTVDRLSHGFDTCVINPLKTEPGVSTLNHYIMFSYWSIISAFLYWGETPALTTLNQSQCLNTEVI